MIAHFGRSVFLFALVSTVLGYVVADVFESWAVRYLPVPWSSVITVAVCAVVILGWTLNFRNKLQQWVDPVQAFRTTALAIAASRAGGILLGLYLGVGVWYVRALPLPVAEDRIITCIAGAVASAALIGAAFWLERVCRLPEPEEEAPDDDPNADWIHPRVTSLSSAKVAL